MVAATQRVAQTYLGTTAPMMNRADLLSRSLQRSLRVLSELRSSGYFVARLPWGQHSRTRGGGAWLPRHSAWHRRIGAPLPR